MGPKNEAVWKKNDKRKESVIFKCALINSVGDGLRSIHYEPKCTHFPLFLDRYHRPESLRDLDRSYTDELQVFSQRCTSLLLYRNFFPPFEL